VFENRLPRRIFGPKRDEVTDNWRKLYIEEPHNLYPSHGEMRNAMKFLLESLMERNHLEDLGVDGKN
jgi:hypothetical protein